MINLDNAQKTFVNQLENKNQFVITYLDNGVEYWAFQSYRTLIAIYCPTTKEMLINWDMFDYSKTTTKHTKIFINTYTCYTYDNKQQFINLIKNNDKISTF